MVGQNSIAMSQTFSFQFTAPLINRNRKDSTENLPKTEGKDFMAYNQVNGRNHY